ncbi:MAG: hypothetical protein KGQ93_06140 [Cyanobacteria bacterium REEB459]|nr:hypothetical protein [Cyanobacteria bacterium REEB459]
MNPLPRRALTPETKAQPQTRRASRRQINRQMAKFTPLLEVVARLSVSSFLALVSLSSLGQLIPYIYRQAHHLQDVRVALNAAEAANLQLKSDFSRYFDPAQTGDLIEEQSGYKYANQRPIVWIHPAK